MLFIFSKEYNTSATKSVTNQFISKKPIKFFEYIRNLANNGKKSLRDKGENKCIEKAIKLNINLLYCWDVDI